MKFVCSYLLLSSLLLISMDTASAEIGGSSGQSAGIDYDNLGEDCTLDAYWGVKRRRQFGAGDSLGMQLFGYYCHLNERPGCPDGMSSAGRETVYYPNGTCAVILACCPTVVE